MPHYPSKERVERDGVLLYPEGFPIPDSDVEELQRQGYLEKAKTPAADKSRKAGPNK